MRDIPRKSDEVTLGDVDLIGVRSHPHTPGDDVAVVEGTSSMRFVVVDVIALLATEPQQ